MAIFYCFSQIWPLKPSWIHWFSPKIEEIENKISPVKNQRWATVVFVCVVGFVCALFACLARNSCREGKAKTFQRWGGGGGEEEGASSSHQTHVLPLFPSFFSVFFSPFSCGFFFLGGGGGWFVFWRGSGEESVVVASSVSSFPVFLLWFDACEWFCRLSSPLLSRCWFGELFG